MKILISGAGIAGPTLAYWLLRHGHVPTIIEYAPTIRTGGYVMDFWGLGFEVAERMGVVESLRSLGYPVESLQEVDDTGRPIVSLSATEFVRAAQGRYVSIQRGDLSQVLYRLIKGQVETIFGDGISQIEEHADGLVASFEKAEPRKFDLVIGADGLHSKVRDLAFGPEQRFETYLGYKAAAFSMEGYRPRDELAYVTNTQVGRMAARFAMRNDRTMFLLVFDDPSQALPPDREAQLELVSRHFAESGWEVPEMLIAMRDAQDLYFDNVSQVRMSSGDERWTKGRVALVGDAAACISLVGGQGSALAMIEAYVLAGELKVCSGDYATAFRRYQDRLDSFLTAKQAAAKRFGRFFAPKNRLRLFFRNQGLRLFAVPWLSERMIDAQISDRLKLISY